MTGGVDGASSPLSDRERERYDAYRTASSLESLAEITGESSVHDAYFAAKNDWRTLREKLVPDHPSEGFPGAHVEVEGHDFHVHGITHANTEAEGEYLRDHVRDATERGAWVYCEQGIRQMYFQDIDAVCEMDDYRWAMATCREQDIDSHLDELQGEDFAGLVEDVDSLAGQFREAVFSLIHRSTDGYGTQFRSALGDVAAEFLVSHEQEAIGQDFEAFRLNKRAAEDPRHLIDLQRYYETSFLPQPLEREWLRRHDPELEIVTHARNERMAEYVLHHNDTADEVHLIVGAAHQPGVRYYLEQYRNGNWRLDGFEPY